MPPLADALPSLVPCLSSDLRRYLMSSFPNTCHGAIEDATQDALLQLAAQSARADSTACRAWAQDGAAGVRRLAFVVGWRALRGQLRRHGSTWVSLPMALRGDAAPDDQLIAAQTARRLPAMLDEAGPRFASRAPHALRHALVDSLRDGEPDAIVAARHGLRREPLCRARRWLQEQLAA